ncbi:MAG TPA: fructosamine kinase family protein, partial [Naasia sp.]
MVASSRTFSKQRKAPSGSLEAEAAGLAWLAAAPGGARIARVLSVAPDVLELEELPHAPPTRAAAREFGAALARTHAAGAAGFGAPPDGWAGPLYLGRQELPATAERPSWGPIYAELRVLFYLRRAEQRGHVSPEEARVVRAACARIADGDFDDDEEPARLHGDLWNGNVLWTPDGVVLIDPAASGGHPETDLAMLALFGCPHLDDILGGYSAEHPLRPGWQDRVPLHQLHPLAVHAASHGASYAAPLTAA